MSFTGFSSSDLNAMSKARNFAKWIGRSESLLRNVENRVVPLSKNLAHRIAERTGVSEFWLISDPPASSTIPDMNGQPWDPLRLYDPLFLGDYDFRSALAMTPQVLLRLALAIIEADSTRSRERCDHTPLIRLMEWIKQSIPIEDPDFVTALEAKLRHPDLADAHQLWSLAKLATNAKSGMSVRTGGTE